MPLKQALKISEVTRKLDGEPWIPVASMNLFQCQVIAYNSGPCYLIHDEPDLSFRELSKEEVSRYEKIDKWQPE